MVMSKRRTFFLSPILIWYMEYFMNIITLSLLHLYFTFLTFLSLDFIIIMYNILIYIVYNIRYICYIYIHIYAHKYIHIYTYIHNELIKAVAEIFSTKICFCFFLEYLIYLYICTYVYIHKFYRWTSNVFTWCKKLLLIASNSSKLNLPGNLQGNLLLKLRRLRKELQWACNYYY